MLTEDAATADAVTADAATADDATADAASVGGRLPAKASLVVPDAAMGVDDEAGHPLGSPPLWSPPWVGSPPLGRTPPGLRHPLLQRPREGDAEAPPVPKEEEAAAAPYRLGLGEPPSVEPPPGGEPPPGEDPPRPEAPHRLGLGEATIAATGRTPRSLAMLFRGASAPLVNHAISTSEDGGETWTSPRPLPSLAGPTCQGSVGAFPSHPGQVLLSAPHSGDAGLGGRENLGVWALDLTRGQAAAPRLVGRLWGCKGAYSSYSQDGSLNLFEAGETFRYESIVLAHLELNADNASSSTKEQVEAVGV